MRAQAPGKVVLSGAYSVLYGAPAVVSAVDRYAVADANAITDFEPPEVALAVADGLLARVPNLDAAALRFEGRKLGLGSSAALLVSALATALPCQSASDRRNLFEYALSIHRRAQGGGSGVDVAASTFGGTLVYLPPRGEQGASVEPHALPTELVIEVWSSPDAASTAQFLKAVEESEKRTPNRFESIMADLKSGAEAAAQALQAGPASRFIDALRTQADGFRRLGALAQIPIFTPEVERLWQLAQSEQALVLPAGAGGGDVALFVGTAPPSEAMRRAMQRERHARLDCKLGAAGVSQVGART